MTRIRMAGQAMTDEHLLRLLRGSYMLDDPARPSGMTRDEQLALGAELRDELMGEGMDFAPYEAAANFVDQAAEPLQVMYHRTTGASAAELPEEFELAHGPQYADWRRLVGL